MECNPGIDKNLPDGINIVIFIVYKPVHLVYLVPILQVPNEIKKLVIQPPLRSNQLIPYEVMKIF
jgi:hypothetical protein